MNAAVFHGPADVRIEVRPELGEPGPGELLLEVLRASICGSDAAEYDHGPVLVPLRCAHAGSGHHGPLVLGHEFVGRVVARGPGAERFNPGDRVVSGAGVSCGACPPCRAGRTNLCERYFTLGLQADGGLAERVLAPASTCVHVPAGCSDDAAALAQPFAVALHALRRGEAGPDDTLVVNGAGGIGAFAVAGARAWGVRQIVAVDVDAARLRTAGRLGAHRLVDARDGDPVEAIMGATGGRGADVVLETSGTAQAPAICVRGTRAGGRVVIVGLQRRPPVVDLLDVALREIELRGALAHVCRVDIPEALRILAERDVAGEVVDRVIGLSRLVPDGLAPLAAGEVRGKVLVDPRG